jgi:TolB-like protein
MWRRLRERRMVQWTVAYLAGAWLLMQVLHLVGEQFGIPVALLRSVTAVLGVGVLAALVVAWYHGERGSQRVSGAELLMLGAILVIAASSVAMVREPLPPGQAVAASELVGSVADLRPFPVAREKSIAVLPFANLSDERQDEHFSDGLTEELLVDLARMTNLRVISRTSVMRYKDAQVGVREIGDELGVGHVVTGSVRRVGERVRIIAQLIDARTDEHVWAESYDSDWHDLLTVQRQISSNIVASLRAALPSVDVAAGVPVAAHPVSGQAYQLYLQGKHHFNNRFAAGHTLSLTRSADLLGQAVAADPSFARAWAALGLTYAHLAGSSRGSAEEQEWAARAQTALGQAIALDARAADAYVARGMIHAHRLRWSEAERSFLLALQSEPQNASAHDWYGTILVSAGRSREAERILRRSAELDPINARTLHWLADALRNSGRIEESLLQAQRSVDLGMRVSAIAMYIYHIQRREWDAAIASEEASLRDRGIDPVFLRPLVDAIRDPRRIPAAVAKTAAVADTTPALVTVLPSLYYDLADPNPAFDAVDVMIPQGTGLYALWRMWEPQFTHLRNHPRFRDLARRMGLVEYWREFGWPDLCRPEGDSFVCR